MFTFSHGIIYQKGNLFYMARRLYFWKIWKLKKEAWFLQYEIKSMFFFAKNYVLVLFCVFGWKTQYRLCYTTKNIKFCTQKIFFVKVCLCSHFFLLNVESNCNQEGREKFKTLTCIFSIDKCISYNFHSWNCMISFWMPQLLQNWVAWVLNQFKIVFGKKMFE